ncbi:MAG: NFACT family protein [Chloracidobacterium sp.]|nr:NFACT family protein [Chloracidobacterium sp.]
MNAETLDRIVDEIDRELAGKRFGRFFQLSANEVAIDIRGPATRSLYINFSPGSPLIYLIRRKLRELERAAGNPSPFVLTLGKRLANSEFLSAVRLNDERVVRIDLAADDDAHGPAEQSLIVQLTGRSSNLFLLDGTSLIIDRARRTDGEGQQIGDIYAPPVRPAGAANTVSSGPDDIAVRDRPDEPSEALDEFYRGQADKQRFLALVDSARKKNRAAVRKIEGLKARLEEDLARHGNADTWKHFADLLLANVSTARRDGNALFVTDYFDENAPEVAIEADEGMSVSEAAEHYYRRYTRARNAIREIGKRLEEADGRLTALRTAGAVIETEAEEGNISYFDDADEKQGPRSSNRPREKAGEHRSSYRTFVSSDGFEILVGKKAKDNDILTLKVARSLDTWLHAADYPGSHVVVRQAGKKELPQRTLIEAAKLAAFYSQGRTQPKAAVHYTLKKFVNKPKGWAPGQVRLASFKTILVEPEVPDLERR